MSFLQLVFSLDKTIEGNNSILENMSILTDIATALSFPELLFLSRGRSQDLFAIFIAVNIVYNR